MNKLTLVLLSVLFSLGIFAQGYRFETLIDLAASKVKSQGQTGTCWSFATTSFLESEIMRITGNQLDISEMFIVRNTYEQKAWNYVMRQGNTRFSEGGLAHDVINTITDFGIVPQSEFTDIFGNDKIYNHNEIVPAVKTILDAYIKNDINSEYPNWKMSIAPLLDKEIGIKTGDFTYKNKKFNPHTFREYLKIEPENYLSLTSFSHEKFFSSFILNIPDNFANGSFYNVPIELLVTIVAEALEKGFTITIDADVSEKTFSSKYGIAVLPKSNDSKEMSYTKIVTEMEVTQTFRQDEFENFNTTDDHLMHISGLVKDQKGNKYFKVKNSWGNNSKRIGNDGFIYMSIPYFKLKTISILLHKDALSEKIQNQLKL